MPNVSIEVLDDDLAKLGAEIDRYKRRVLGRLAERGYQLLRREVPVETGNLKQGVAPAEVDYDAMEAVLTVSARSGMTGRRVAEVYGSDGKKKRTVSLKPQPAFNYAETVARGNKAGPSMLKPMLIPISSKPEKGGYLMVGGQVYIVRKSRKRQRPNPFDQRAADTLQSEAVKIAEAQMRALLG
ncbi:MAG: hypothetical protein IPM50_02625 [Acidobacteriota bacterium]|nr:MAG: hypothetical protein IPM50_02625 [Acidobacteriota bacterium]